MKTIVKMVFVWAVLPMVFFACKKEKEEGKGSIEIQFVHKVEGALLEVDQMIYENAAGNPYEVNEVQWFITRLEFYKEGSKVAVPEENTKVHYVDTDLPETFNYLVWDAFPEGVYDSLVFTFGFNQADNISYSFPNPPESNMFWPEVMGGGYHYMKLNGKWRDTVQNIRSFNFHLGIGQIYEEDNPLPIELIHNHFKVCVPLNALKIENDKTTQMELVMQIEKWFKEPNTWDHNVVGSHIMKKQEAMKAGCENGHNVFALGQVSIKQ